MTNDSKSEQLAEEHGRLNELTRFHNWLIKNSNVGITRSLLYKYVDDRMEEINPTEPVEPTNKGNHGN